MAWRRKSAHTLNFNQYFERADLILFVKQKHREVLLRLFYESCFNNARNAKMGGDSYFFEGFLLLGGSTEMLQVIPSTCLCIHIQRRKWEQIKFKNKKNWEQNQKIRKSKLAVMPCSTTNLAQGYYACCVMLFRFGICLRLGSSIPWLKKLVKMSDVTWGVTVFTRSRCHKKANVKILNISDWQWEELDFTSLFIAFVIWKKLSFIQNSFHFIAR